MQEIVVILNSGKPRTIFRGPPGFEIHEDSVFDGDVLYRCVSDAWDSLHEQMVFSKRYELNEGTMKVLNITLEQDA